MVNKDKIYRAALIGCGSMGSYYMDELAGLKSRTILPLGHAEVLQTHPRTELVAGADPDRSRLDDFGRRWGVDHLYTDYREMLERERPEIVSIASPPPLHPQHVIDCAERGVKGLFCEKPIAPTLGQTDAMLAACDRQGVKLAINHTRRGDPFVHQVRHLLQSGEIGDILSLTMTWAGRLFLTGTHCFDLVNYLLGDIPPSWLIGHAEDPAAEMKVVPTQRGVDVGGSAYIVYQSGVRALLNGRDGHALLRVDIFGSQGAISHSDYETHFWKSNAQSPFREPIQYPLPQMMRYTAPMVFLLEDLIAAMETDRAPMSSGRTARRALEQILATHYSSQHDNSKVHFPFTELDMAPPYQWFGEGGGAVYRADSAGKRD